MEDDGYSYGDEREVDCPSCGYKMDMTDLGIDGCLHPGFETNCPKCEEIYKIEDVDWSACVTVCRKKESK